MLFGFCNSLVMFERFMEMVLVGFNYKICLVYIDDIIVFGCIFGEIFDNLKLVFCKLEIVGLKLRVKKKCFLFKKEVLFFDYKLYG